MKQALFALVLFAAAASAQESCCIEGTGAEWSRQPGAHDPGPCLLDKRCTKHSNLTDKPPPRCGIKGPDGVWHGWLLYDGPQGKMCDWPGNSPHVAQEEQRTPEQMADEAKAAVTELVARNTPAGGALDRPKAEAELNQTIEALQKICGTKGGEGDDEAIGRVSPPCQTAIQNLRDAFDAYVTGSGDAPVANRPAGPTGESNANAAAAPANANAPAPAANANTPASGATGYEDGDEVPGPVAPDDRAEQQCATPHYFTFKNPDGSFKDDYHHVCRRRTMLIDRDDQGRTYAKPQPWRHSQLWDDEIAQLPPVSAPRERCGGAHESLGPNMRREDPRQTKPEKTRCSCGP